MLSSYLRNSSTLSGVRIVRSNKLSIALSYIFMSGIILSLVGQILLPWSYLIFSVLFSIMLMTFFFNPEQKTPTHYYIIVSVLMIFLPNIYNIGVRYQIINSYDAYQELMHVRILLNTGHNEVNMQWNTYQGPSPVDSSVYPLFSILVVTLKLTTGMDLLHIAFIVPLINELVSMLFVMLILKTLLQGSAFNDKVLALAFLIFTISPDSVFTGMIFYMRTYSINLGFLILYLLFRISYTNSAFDSDRKKYIGLFIFVLMLFPLSHSYYPVTIMIALVVLAVLGIGLRIFLRESFVTHLNLHLPKYAWLIALSANFLWNFQLVTGSIIAGALKVYFYILQHPDIGISEIKGYSTKFWRISEILRPEPIVHILQVRDLVLWSPFVVNFVLRLYKFIKVRGKVTNKDLIILLVTSSFLPLTFSNIIAGKTVETLEIRNYAMPLFIFSSSTLFLNLMSKYRKAKFILLTLLGIITLTAFASPYSHVFIPRQLYDPSIKFEEVGFPSPDYMEFRLFIEKHPLEKGLISAFDAQGYISYLVLPLSNISAFREPEFLRYYEDLEAIQLGNYTIWNGESTISTYDLNHQYEFRYLGKMYILVWKHVNFGGIERYPGANVRNRFEKVLDSDYYQLYYYIFERQGL